MRPISDQLPSGVLSLQHLAYLTNIDLELLQSLDRMERVRLSDEHLATIQSVIPGYEPPDSIDSPVFRYAVPDRQLPEDVEFLQLPVEEVQSDDLLLYQGTVSQHQLWVPVAAVKRDRKQSMRRVELKSDPLAPVSFLVKLGHPVRVARSTNSTTAETEEG